MGLGPGQGQGLRHLAGPRAGLARRAAGRPRHARRVPGERRGAHRLAHGRDAVRLGRDPGGRRAQHAGPAGRRGDRLGHGGQRLHPRARRRALAGGGRRGGAGDRGAGRAAQPRRPARPESLREPLPEAHPLAHLPDARPRGAARGPGVPVPSLCSYIHSYWASFSREASSCASASAAGSAPKNSLSSAWLRISASAPVGSARQSASAAAPRLREPVVLAAPPALLLLGAEQAGRGQPLGLDVERGVLERPEVADRVRWPPA